MKRLLFTAVGEIVATSAAPYGYTITTWSTGAVLIRSRGLPTIAEVFAFVAGALIGFGILALLSVEVLPREEPEPSLQRPRQRTIAGALNWIAVPTAVGAVALIAQIHGWVPWLLGSLAATVLYLTGAGIELALVRRSGVDQS